MPRLHAVAPTAISSASDEVPGLRAAFAAVDAARAKLDAIEGRASASRSNVTLRTRDRDALVSRAAAGEEVQPSDLRLADDAIRDAEAALTLAEAALPRVAGEVEAAQAAVKDITRSLWAEARRQVAREYEEAQAAALAAQERQRVAFGRYNTNGTLPPDLQQEVNARIAAHR